MKPPSCRALDSILACALIWMLLGLGGCASIESAGSVTTRDDRPLILEGGGQRLLIEPGTMSVEIGERPLPGFESRLAIRTRHGELETKTHAEDFSAESLILRGASRGLSADILATWKDVPEGEEIEEGSEDCTYSGWCTKRIRVRRCPDGVYDEDSRQFRKHKGAPGCSTQTDYRDGYHQDCPGRQLVRTRYERYRRHYQMRFMSPTPLSEPLADYRGESAPRRRKVGQEILEPCH